MHVEADKTSAGTCIQGLLFSVVSCLSTGIGTVKDEMNFIVALLARYLGQRDKRSHASILYEEAHLRGTSRDQLREKLRRAVREILAFYVFAVLTSILYLEKPGVPE